MNKIEYLKSKNSRTSVASITLTASPIVVGAVRLLHGMYRCRGRVPLCCASGPLGGVAGQAAAYYLARFCASSAFGKITICSSVHYCQLGNPRETCTLLKMKLVHFSVVVTVTSSAGYRGSRSPVSLPARSPGLS